MTKPLSVAALTLALEMLVGPARSGQRRPGSLLTSDAWSSPRSPVPVIDFEAAVGSLTMGPEHDPRGD
jgi:hypothetical protein